MKLVTSAQMRALEERSAAAGVSHETLMDNAGLAVAQEVWMQLGTLEDRRIVVLVGPGNNGGDGLVAARHLAEWGAQVHCYALKPRDDAQWQATLAAGIACSAVADDAGFATLDELFSGAEVVVDALLGTGQAGAVAGDLAEILKRLAAARGRPIRPKLVAVDLPTGLNADTGRVAPLTVAPDETVTFQFPKVGLYTQPGAGVAGDVQTVEIGIPSGLDDDLQVELLDRRQAQRLLPARAVDANKGSFGKVLIVAGSANYPGATVLAASAAYRAGAGLVTLATARSLIPALVGAMPEVTYLPLPEGGQPAALDPDALPELTAQLPRYDTLLIGCGLGQAPSTVAAVRQLLGDPSLSALRGVVIDADALNALAGSEWPAQLSASFILTPHPGEMARLIGSDAAAVQAARLEVAQQHAAAWGGCVVLKGANTVIAAPDGRARISPVATAALATAGTGDVLAGAIAGLIAQGLAPFDAGCLGVYLHGNAGERAAKSAGTAGTTAGDVLTQLAQAGRALAGEEPSEGGGAGRGALAGLGGGLGALADRATAGAGAAGDPRG
ncbi:MAG: NAD(P)H-hydrate dehydratase [Dehalococcoidia bacterium]